MNRIERAKALAATPNADNWDLAEMILLAIPVIEAAMAMQKNGEHGRFAGQTAYLWHNLEAALTPWQEEGNE